VGTAANFSIGCGSDSVLDSESTPKAKLNSGRENHPLFSYILANKQFKNPSVE